MKGLWPLIIRELRDQSRQPLTYWLRVIALASLLLVILSISTSNSLYGDAAGQLLFGKVNAVLFACIWIFVPLLVADCISREKREGTLGLLFLTPLTGGSVMAAKSFVHALRASALLLATIPALAIPFLLGGVTRTDLVGAFIVNAAALGFALTAGLLASLLSKRWTRATFASVLFSILALYVFVNVYSTLYPGPIPTSFRGAWIKTTSPYGITAASPPGRRTRIWSTGPNGNVITSGSFVVPRVFQSFAALTPTPAIAVAATTQSNLEAAGTMLSLAALFFLIVWLWAARTLPLVLSNSSPSKTQVKLERRFCTPVLFAKGFKRRLRTMLDQNPIGWLEQYSWSARLTKWGWCMAALLFELFIFHNAMYEEYQSSPPWFFPVLFAALALSACNSFSREKENGALELLLVTPLSEQQIIWGRLLGLWMQVLPAIGFYAVMYQAFHARLGDYSWSVMMVETTLCTAVVGLCFSLTGWNLFVRWIATVLVSASPWIVSAGSRLLYEPQFFHLQRPATPAFSNLQLVFAIAAFLFLQHRLRFRQFTMVATSTAKGA